MNKYLDRFEAGFRRLSEFFAALVAISIGLFAILIPLDLLIRRLGWGNMPWLHEGVEYTLYMGVFLGAPWVLQQGAHVRVDLIVTNLRKEAALRMERLLDLIGTAICAVLCQYGIRATIEAYMEHAVPDKLLKIENWWMLLVFSITFFMLTIEFLLRMRGARFAADQAKPSTTELGL